MSATVYKKIDLVGTSKLGVEDAIANAVAHAAAAGEAVDWFEVVETRGAVRDGKVVEYQVVVQLGCRAG